MKIALATLVATLGATEGTKVHRETKISREGDEAKIDRSLYSYYYDDYYSYDDYYYGSSSSSKGKGKSKSKGKGKGKKHYDVSLFTVPLNRGII